MRKLVLVLLVITLNAYSQSAPPTLLNFRIENGQTSRVYFDSSKPIKASKSNGFIISDKTITGLSINSGQTSGHYFKVSKSFTYWDNNTIRYEGGSDFADNDNNVLSNFTLKYIENRIKEPGATKNTYYVSLKGNDSNSGTSESQSWRTISKAAETVKSGSTVWIKAGNYGNENVVIKNSGKKDDPIKFIGYKNTIGDNPRLTRNESLKFDGKSLPYIVGNSKNGVGINFAGKNYIILKNIVVEGYRDGIDFSKRASYNLLENVYVKGSERYGFNGFNRESKSNRVKDSYVSNSSGAGIRLSGEGHLIENMYASSKGTPNMDYYISLYGANTAGNHIIRNSTIKRDPSDTHTGHGISIKADEENWGLKIEHTLIENCTIDNVGQAVELRHSKVKYTIVRNVTATGLRNSNSNLITFRDDTSYNTIENCTANGLYQAIRFTMNSGEEYGIQGGGHYNKIINTVFNNCRYIITISGINGVPLESTNNEFINCTFFNADYFASVPVSFGNSNKIINSIISNVKKKSFGKKSFSPEISYSNFYNSYSKPTGSGNLSEDPMFENSSTGDFRLKRNSPLIDKGLNTNKVISDFNGNHRPQGSSNDMGAFEFNDDTTTGSIKADAGEDQTICIGESIILTASGGSTYQWSNGATTGSIEVSPTETTNYSVTVTEGSQSAIDEVVITVNEVIANAGEDLTIDEGENITLTASGGDSYLWNNGETSQNITVSPNSSTTYSVTVSKDGCEDVDSVEVFINSSSSSMVNAYAGEDQTICPGETITLTANGGETYEWSTGETTESIEVSPNERTIYSVKAIIGNNSATDEVIVSLFNITANAGEDVAIDEGDSTTLSASGGDNYLWSNGSTTASIEISPTKTTSYTVTVYKDGCEVSDTVEVFVNQGIVSDPPPASANAGQNVTICLGESITLTASGGSTYSWSTGETNKSIQVNPNRTTSYTLSATRGGVTNSDEVTVTVENCNNIVSDEDILRDFEMYPNPTSGILNVKISNIKKEMYLALISVNGSIIYQDKINSKQGSVSKQINLSKFAKGVYFVRLYNSDQNMVKKILLI